MSTADLLRPIVIQAIVDTLGDDFRNTDPALRPSNFADVQANCALELAHRTGARPRDLAQRLLEDLDRQGVSRMADVSVSGPGYLNFTFKESWLASELNSLAQTVSRPAPEHRAPTKKVVIDYSAPNVAKEMHVGHLRTTIVGDSLARVLEHQGNDVLRQNHIGDWGTPFGMLIEQLLDVGLDSPEALLIRDDPNAFYQSARARFDRDASFADRARNRVVKLQSHEPETIEIWASLLTLSRSYFNRVYSALDVTLEDSHLAGESFYSDRLADVCSELTEMGLATISDGALCVFLPEFPGREGQPSPLIIRKRDGGYTYATTDLAALRYRVDEIKANRLIYVVGATQELHLRMVWSTARLAGWLPADVVVTHVKIGSVLGSDHKILRTRAGSSPRLLDLVHSAEERIRENFFFKEGTRPEEQQKVAEIVGVGAIKYAELSVSHDADYVFDVERMTSFIGNTGPYLQYAGARIHSLFAKAGVTLPQVLSEASPISIDAPTDRALAVTLLDFPGVLREVDDALAPHKLCAHLYELAQNYSTFYESSPVLQAPSPEIRAARLRLTALVLHQLTLGLGLLGISTPTSM